MTTHLILFDRDGNDEVLGVERGQATNTQIVDQLRAELLEAGISGIVVRGIIKTASTEYRAVILTELFFDGTRRELVEYLQKAYDDFGIEGFFETCEPEWSAAE